MSRAGTSVGVVFVGTGHLAEKNLQGRKTISLRHVLREKLMVDKTFSNYGLELPTWVAEFFREPGGITLQEIDLAQLSQICQHQTIDRLFVDESFVDEKRSDSPHIKVIDLMEQGRVHALIVYSNHPWHIPTSIMNKLDKLAMSCPVN